MAQRIGRFRIGPGIQQQLNDRLETARCTFLQWRHIYTFDNLARPLLGIRACREQDPNGLFVTFSDGKEEHGITRGRPQVRVSALTDKELESRSVAASCSRCQCFGDVVSHYGTSGYFARDDAILLGNPPQHEEFLHQLQQG